jgi:hypothetical protein
MNQARRLTSYFAARALPAGNWRTSKKRWPGWRQEISAAVSSAEQRSTPGCSRSSPRDVTARAVRWSLFQRSGTHLTLRPPVDDSEPLTALTSLQVGSAISYVVAVLVPALDAIIPVLPSYGSCRS